MLPDLFAIRRSARGREAQRGDGISREEFAKEVLEEDAENLCKRRTWEAFDQSLIYR